MNNRRLQVKTARRAMLMTLLLTGLAGCAFLVGCGGTQDGAGAGPKKKVPTVAVEPARKESIAQVLDLTGETVAVESVVIAATVEGPISYCPWREGDRVETAPDEPTKLIEINRELYRSEVYAAEAALEVARAKLADLMAGTRPEEILKAAEAVRQLEESASFAKSDLERITKLVESGSLPGEALEKARVEYVAEQSKLSSARRQLEMLEAGYTKTAIAVQEAVVKESNAKLNLAQARLSECVIYAPFSGTITRVHVRSGDMASTKAPLLEMADLSSLVIRVAVPEAYTATVREGMRAEVQLDALPGRTFAARVVRIFPDLDRRMRTRTVELVLDEQAALMPGMFARVRLVLEAVDEAVTVPLQAVGMTPAGAQVVYVVVDGKALQRKVKTGIEQAGRVQVLSGLEAGAKVIVAGLEKLKDGADVRVTEAGKPAGRPESAPSASAGMEGTTP
ncbi:MAG: efflux RND transporter periplasmic adaptor subunit [Planctomycetota bacterium]